MTEKIINCSACGRGHFVNEFEPVKSGIGHYMLCPKCAKVLNRRLGSKQFVATMIRNTMSLNEWQRLRDERRMAYAGSAFGFGRVWA